MKGEAEAGAKEWTATAEPMIAEVTEWDEAQRSICEALMARYAGSTDRADVEAVVARLFASFTDARIRTYVPIFVERAAIEELRRRLG